MDQLVIHHKYPELEVYDIPIDQELLDKRLNLYKQEPLVNGYFVTQAELEQKLLVIREAMDKYGMPFLDNL